MVHIILASSKGNGVRFFPYTGYLGLTPVKVEGAVVTVRDADLKQLPTKSITISVKCYESRVGRVGVTQSNVLVDYTQVLWTKPEGQEYGDIGDSEHPFRISIPSRVGGFSTTSFVEYRCVWRVEAVLNHVPISGVGARQTKSSELILIRYDLPPPLLSAPSHFASEPQLHLQTSKPRAPRIRYSVNTPANPVGPMDLVAIPIHLLPVDPGVSIRSASVIIERRLLFHDTASPSSPTSPLTPQSAASFPSASFMSRSSSSPPSTSSLLSYSSPASNQDPSYNALLSTSSLSSSNPTITPNSIYPSSTSVATEYRQLLPPVTSPPVSPTSEANSPRVVVHPVAGAESSGAFARSASGIWSKTLTVQWPMSKSSSRWAVGETIHSDVASVKFYVRVKIIVTAPSGTDSLELEEQEILVVSTNEAERQLAMSKFNEFLYSSSSDNPRSKSKSPRRSKRERERDREQEPPLPSPASVSKADPGHKVSSSSQYPSHSGKGKSPPPRRPHTSAGPRDKVRMDGSSSYTRATGHDSSSSSSHPRRREVNGGGGGSATEEGEPPLPSFRRRRGARPDTTGGTTESMKINVLGYLLSPRLASNPSGSSTSSTSVTASMSTSSVSSSSQESEKDVKEWEEELARIEQASRKSSDMLGFGDKKKRLSGDSSTRILVAGKG